ncbi:MAG: hypothetical protein BGO98_05470 [Myxococcales bacterium 68-20]|nr:hypothetical protein [Myxococcales bacterium]OJY28522.1 MAG: hypothetical protein BGO98_05470 [Myxococcales bacterium 68-20]
MGRFLYAGADVRAYPSGDSDWTPERRMDYLLRPEVTFPLSVDPQVWKRFPTDLPGPLAWIPIVEVERRVALMPSKHRLCVAIFGAAAEDDAEAEDLRRRTGAETALTADQAWTFVGFDVADDVIGVSGLSNCGYGEELDELRAAWASRLNEHGLFRHLDEAFGFRKLTDARVSEHAPFTVYGIWVVLDLST